MSARRAARRTVRTGRRELHAAMALLADFLPVMRARDHGTPTFTVPVRVAGGVVHELVPGREPFLAPGVRGVALQHEGATWIPLLRAERQGAGDVGRYLDSLAATPGRWRVPSVISARLLGMLKRRGWTRSWARVEGSDEVVDVWSLDVEVPPHGRAAAGGPGRTDARREMQEAR